MGFPDGWQVMANRTTEPQNPSPDPGTTAAPAEESAAAPVRGVIELPASLTVHDLAALITVDPIEVIKQLMRNGLMLTINDAVEPEIAALICRAYGYQVKSPDEEQRGPASLVVQPDEEDLDQLESRPPIVTILGHVDHGKTTLLDGIRQSNVIAGEAGGITQHIGAYQVESDGNWITFLDTPGHEAFTAMRARGAQLTDVAVLVVAADDGVMPQTVEAIDHVKAAGVPMIAAINKIDRPDADPERVKRELSEHDLLVEEWGGDVIAVPLSALTGDGVPDLLANIQVVAEVGELRANPNRLAKGVVVEARIDKSKGPLATVLVQTGTLEVGSNLVAGEVRGRVKAMLNDRGKRIKSAGPSVPVEILGLGGLPEAGEIFVAVSDERSARQMAEAHERERASRRGAGVTLEEIHARIESGEVMSLDLIVKTDVQGTIDAVRSALEALNTAQTRVNLIHAASGGITESDVLLAVASKAIIVGFSSEPGQGARTLANQEGVDIRFYNVIYDLIDDIEKALKGLLAPVIQDVVEGYGTVRATFKLGRNVRVAGIYVNEGIISRGAEVHVVRSGKRLFTGSISSLKHFKDDVREINAGLEGGIVLDGFKDFNEGDIVEAHRSRQVD